MTEALHLVKVPLRADRLVRYARHRGWSMRNLDEGYLAHCVLRELWQKAAPAPFVLRARAGGFEAWGYSRTDAAGLVAHVRDFGDPSLMAVVDGELSSVASRPMPCLEPGRRVGFLLRACPVVRLAKKRGGFEPGSEIDAFLAKCLEVGPQVEVDREQVYRDWLAARVRTETSGVELERVAVAGFSRERLVRRTQGEERRASVLDRPDVRYEGEMRVKDGAKLLEQVARGVGRHRAFGFGALMIVAVGTAYPRG